MKYLHTVALVLSAVGAINWGLMALANMNLVTTLLGEGSLTNVVYILVGLSGVYVLVSAFQGKR